MSDDETKETGEVPPARRGWHLVDLAALKTPPEALAALVYAASTLILTTLIIFGLISTFRFGYETLVGDLKDRVEVAKVFFPVVVALIGGPILIWRALTSHWAAQAARHQAETGREAHFTSLFTKAVEQLGATRDAIRKSFKIDDTVPHTFTETEPNLEVRLGAIYAFERVARDSQRDQWPIMEVLCAYVRNPQNCGQPIERPSGVFPGHDKAPENEKRYSEWIKSLPAPRVDIQAILTVLARRQNDRAERERSRGNRLDFSHANLQRANFHGGRFARASFVGTYLDNAVLREVDLQGSQFFNAHLEQVDMVRARIDGCWFGSAEMDGAHLHQVSGEHSIFDDTHLDYATFKGARLTSPDFHGAHLRRARFNGAFLKDAKLDFGQNFNGLAIV